jgi:Family of unknown function (DUF6069)
MSAPSPICTATNRRTSWRAAQAGLLAAVGSAVAVVALAEVAQAAGVAHEHQLRAASLIVTTVVGVVFGTLGWVVVSARARDPRRVLRVLVPVVLVFSFIPDILIAVGGTTWGAALTLALAHLVVFAVTVPLFLRLLAPETLTNNGSSAL